MNLAQHITELAQRVALELRTRITADHPGVAKAWVSFGVSGTGSQASVVVRASFNIQSVICTTTGKYRVTFLSPMPDANYCWQAFARNAGNQSAMKHAGARATAEVKTAQFVEVICTTSNGTLSGTTEMNLTVWR
jgi:hypothetical protein